MWLHVLIFALFLFVGMTKLNDRKKLIIFFLPLFFLFTFRDTSIGSDTPAYFDFFIQVANTPSLADALKETRFEPGYVVLNWIIHTLNGNFNLLLGVTTAVYYGSIYIFLLKYAKNVPLAAMLLFVYAVLYDVASVMRQCIALAVILFAIDFLIEKKPLRYFALIALAMLFHNSAFIMVPIYFLPRINFTKHRDIMLWFGCSLGVLLVLGFGMGELLKLFPYYSHYFTDSVYGKGGIRFASVIFFTIRIFTVLIIYYAGGFKQQREKFDREDNVFNQMMLLDCVVAAAAILFNMFDRLESYFCVMYIVSISNATVHMKRDNGIISKVLVVVLPFLWSMATLIFRSEWYSIFPYKFA